MSPLPTTKEWGEGQGEGRPTASSLHARTPLPALLERPRLVVANKMDEPAAEENLKKFKRRIRKTPVMTMAAAFDQGIEEFKQTIRAVVS